jgi:hypothetical protein
MLSSVSVEWPCLVWIQLTEIFWTWACRPESSFHCAPNCFDEATLQAMTEHPTMLPLPARELRLGASNCLWGIILFFTMHPPVHTIDIYRYLHRFHRCMDDKICIWTNVKNTIKVISPGKAVRWVRSFPQNWRCPKMRAPPQYPKLDHFSIETYGFGSFGSPPWLKS